MRRLRLVLLALLFPAASCGRGEGVRSEELSDVPPEAYEAGIHYAQSDQRDPLREGYTVQVDGHSMSPTYPDVEPALEAAAANLHVPLLGDAERLDVGELWLTFGEAEVLGAGLYQLWMNYLYRWTCEMGEEELYRFEVACTDGLCDVARVDSLGHVMLGRPVAFFQRPTQSSSRVAWCSSSQARRSVGAGKYRGSRSVVMGSRLGGRAGAGGSAAAVRCQGCGRRDDTSSPGVRAPGADPP